MASVGRTFIRRFMFNTSGWNQLGLRHDDLLYETPEVTEAIRRLPEKIRNERNYRIIRAMQLSLMHRILPKEQWTKYEDDVDYLQPFLDEVIKEKKEKEEWEKNH